MKKLMYAIGLGLISGSVWASCMGPFCWDDRGAYIGTAAIVDGNGTGMPSQTISAINADVPRVVGQQVFCNNCASNGGAGTVCVSTATAAQGFDYVLSTGTKCL